MLSHYTCSARQPSAPKTSIAMLLRVVKNHSYLRSSSIYRLLSTANPEAPSPSPSSTFAVQYLINSCGLLPDSAIRTAKRIPHLKSPEKPDAVLHFLRQAGVTQPDIAAAALRDPRFLCFNVDKCLKPRMAELHDIGFSLSHISLFFSINSSAFSFTKLQERVQFWIQILGSVEKLLAVMRGNSALLTINPKTSSANVSFLQKECTLSVCQIARLIMYAPRLVTFKPEFLKIAIRRAEDLGLSRSSRLFIHALRVVTWLNPSIIEARLGHLRELGLSQEEVSNLLSRLPTVMSITQEMMSRKIEFLVHEAGCDKLYVVQNPCLLTCSLEKRVIPRCRVWKLLEFKGLLSANKQFVNFVVPSEERFVKKFILPYENIMPGLHQAYKDVCAGNTEGIKWFKSITS